MSQLTALQLDALGESGNIAMGAAATALSKLLGYNVEITTPKLTNTTMGEVSDSYTIPCVLVRVNYKEGLQGTNLFILSEQDAGVIAKMMMGDINISLPPTLDELHLSAVSEAMNQMMGSSATALSDMFGRKIDITPPDLKYIQSLQNIKIPDFSDHEEVVQIAFNLTVGEYINSTMLQVVPLRFARAIVEELMGGFQLQEEDFAAPVPSAETVTSFPQEEIKTVPEPVFSMPEGIAEGKVPLELLRDIPVNITRVLGRCQLSLRELMEVTAGSVIELDAAASDEVDIVANGKIVARGEIVLCQENLGIRITELCD